MEKPGIEFYGQIVNVGNLSCSPDGRFLLYTVGTTDMTLCKKQSKLCIYDTKHKQIRSVPAGLKNAGLYWSSNTSVAYLERKKADQLVVSDLYVCDVMTGEQKQVFSVPESIQMVWPLGKDRYLMRGVKDYSSIADQNTEYWAIHTEYPYKSNGHGFVSGMRHTLFLYDKGVLHALTDEKTEASTPVIGPDAQRIWFWGQRYDGCSYPDDAVYQMDLFTGELSEILSRQQCTYEKGFYLDGRLYLVKTPIVTGDDLGTHELWSVLPDGKDVRKELDLSCGNTRMKMMLYDGALYFTDPERSNRPLKRWTPQTPVGTVLDGTIGVEEFVVNEQGIFFIGRKKDCPAELYWHRGEQTVCITGYNTKLAQTYNLQSAEPYSFADMDGYSIDGWCIKPAGYCPGEKYPGILYIHGGPSGFFDGYFMAKMQVFALHGYFVFYCNPRGSGTYGKKHMALCGQFGTYDYQDIMMFTDETLRRYPDIDQERLCVTGGSYGGFMTNWIITHSNRFKAAVSIVSTSNWISKLLCCDNSHEKVLILGATPWENPEKLWQHSPLRYVKQVKTPTLFVQNENDYRSPPCEAEMMFTSLCRMGVPAKMIMNYKASHGTMNIAQIKNQMEHSIAWFDQYGKGSGGDVEKEKK